MLNQPKEFNLIAISHGQIQNAETVQSIISTFDTPTSKRPNIIIDGGLNSKGARLLQQAFTISSIHLAQYYTDGACVPFGFEGHFGSGLNLIANLLPNHFMNYIFPKKGSRPFSAERWKAQRVVEDSNANFQVTVLQPENIIIQALKTAWNFIRYKLTGRYMPQATFVFDSWHFNYAATEAGEAICNDIAKDWVNYFQNTSVQELCLLLDDESKPSFVRLLQASEHAKNLLSKHTPFFAKELKLLAGMFDPKPLTGIPADKYFSEKREEINKVIGQHTPVVVHPAPQVVPALPQVVIVMPVANNAFLQNYERQQAPVENAHVAPAAAVVSAEPPKL